MAATSLGLIGGARLQNQLEGRVDVVWDGRMGREEFGGTAHRRSLRGLNEVSGGSRDIWEKWGWPGRETFHRGGSSDLIPQKVRPHSKRPLRPELTSEWNIPVAWEPQPAFKAHCVRVALSAFDLSLVPLPLLWGLIILGLLGEHGKFLIPISTRTIGAWDLLGWTVNCSWTHKEFWMDSGSYRERLRLRRTKWRKFYLLWDLPQKPLFFFSHKTFVIVPAFRWLFYLLLVDHMVWFDYTLL